MDINRLSKEDMAYELKIYGDTTSSSFDVMRRSLRQFRRLAKCTSYIMPKYPFTFDEDTVAIVAKIKSISDEMAVFSDSRMSPAFAKLSTAIAFAISRVNRSLPTKEEDIQLRSKFLVQLVGLASELRTKAKSFSRNSTMAGGDPLDLTTISNSAVSSESSSDDEDDAPQAVTVLRPVNKSVPVASWGIKFSGHPRDTSLCAFLERVNELKIARNSSDAILYNSAVDLFTGNALIWYRANRDNFSDWNELMCGLRGEFLASDYDDRLFEEIKHRTQGPQESMGMYISVMKNLFARLQTTIPEPTQLKILLKNLLPFYQTQFGLVEISSLSQLLRYGKQLEARKASVEAYVPPPVRSKTLEPDLAYVHCSAESDQTPRVTPRVNTVNAPTIKCWNCNAVGHRAAECSKPRKRHCFRCGRPNVTLPTCPTCSGNGRKTR